MAIGNISQFEAIMSDIKRTADKINYATSTSAKFEDARRTFGDALDLLKRKEPLTKALAARISKACDVFVSELGQGQRVEDQLFDLQDYLEFNPPES